MQQKTSAVSENMPKSRLVAGGLIFIAGLLSPLLITVVVKSDLSTGTKTLLSGALAFGIPELGMLLAIIILGKKGFAYLKQLLVKFIRRNFAPPQKVSRMRYRAGLVMIVLPVLLSWIGPYLIQYVFVDKRLILLIALTGDVLFLAALFVLGGDFWDKLRALFHHEARVTLPSKNDKSKKE